MSDEQKALFKQLQIAGLGIVLVIMGIILSHKQLLIIGLFVLIYGMIRFYLIQKLVNNIKEDE